MADLVEADLEDMEDMEDIMEGIMAAVADTVDREVVDTVDRDLVCPLAVEVLVGQEVVVVVDDGKRELVL